MGRLDVAFQFTPVVRRATEMSLNLAEEGVVFQFTPVVRRATVRKNLKQKRDCFNSRPSCDGRLRAAVARSFASVSIHARRATGDKTSDLAAALDVAFQFTPVVRRATSPRSRAKSRKQFQFTPVVRRATSTTAVNGAYYIVSIHARRATGDLDDIFPGAFFIGVSIHARRATGDFAGDFCQDCSDSFNSRPSCDGRRYCLSSESI